LVSQLITELLDAAGLEEEHDTKARFAASFVLDALAPTNTLPGNPAAVRQAFDTGCGRLPERADRADPVRAAGRTGTRSAAAVLSAVDQQVLHHGSCAR